MTDAEPLVDIRDLIKEYGGLRPLRLAALTVPRGEIVTVAGLDQPAAEMLVTLVTGASLPDRGRVVLFGRGTDEIDDSAAWLESLDGIGMVSHRVVLLEPCSARQNIALSLTLDIEPLGETVREKADALASEAGIRPEQLEERVAALDADTQMRVRLARAVALDPQLLICEHPTATLPRTSVEGFAADVARLSRARSLGVLAITADPVFARGLGGTSLTLDPATGGWKPQGMWERVSHAILGDKGRG